MSVKTQDRPVSRAPRSRKKPLPVTRFQRLILIGRWLLRIHIPVPARIKRHLPAWILLAAVLMILGPRVIAVTTQALNHLAHGSSSSDIAPLFSPAVQHWGQDIDRWANANDLDPNLLASVMQIESCGHPTINSVAGAQGLFQVMPFNFQVGDNYLDPETNAERGANVLKQCKGFANGDAGLAMACYNGGPSVLSKPFAAWADQTQRYYYWGTGIYEAATQYQSDSPRLDEWLAAGGAKLCQMAGTALGI
jgi:soluble lytic murein transglycosylase-like protein